MDTRDQQQLTTFFSQLTQDLMPSDVFVHLIQEGILSEDDVEIIEHEKTRIQQNRKLISILKTKGPRAFLVFCEALKSTHVHLYDLLKNYATQKLSQHRDILEKIQCELKSHYQQCLSKLSPIPWCEWFQLTFHNVYTSLKLVRGVQRKAFQSAVRNPDYDNSVAVEEIFKAHQECASPSHILVEGDAGIGKTTLCHKLVYDWTAKDFSSSHNESIQSYDLVFHLQAKEFSNAEYKSVVDVIYSKLLPEDFPMSREIFQSCLENDDNKILFIVDSYDEAEVKQCQLLDKLIRRSILNHCNVVLCSRPSYALHQLKHFDTLYRVVGYDSVQKLEFIQRFAQELDIPMSCFQGLLGKLQTDRAVIEISKTPLNLSILCLLCAEENQTFPATRTALYQEMHDFIVKREQTRFKDLELGNDELPLFHLYELSYETLKRKQCSFSEEDLASKNCTIESVTHVGFLTKKVKISRFSQQTHFEFIHRSFQEFFAAKYMAKLDSSRRNKILFEVLGTRIFRSSCRFLLGLLCNDECALIDFATIWFNEAQYSPADETEFDRLSVFDLTECHKGHLLLQSLCELTDIPDGLAKVLAQNLPRQICFSFPLCTVSCVEGLLKVCQVLVKQESCPNSILTREKLSVIIPAYCFDLKPDVFSTLFQQLTLSRCIDSVGIFNIAEMSQLVSAFQLLKVGHPKSSVKYLKLRFLGIVQGSSADFPEQPFAGFTQGIEIYQCPVSGVVNRMIQAIPCSQHLKRIIIKQCNINLEGCSMITKKLESFSNLNEFCLVDHSLNTSGPKEMIELLAKLSGLTTLQTFHLSHFPSVASSSDSALSSLKKILDQNDIKDLGLFESAFSEHVCRTLQLALSQMKTLEKLSINNGLLTCHTAFDRVLAEIQHLTNLRHLELQDMELAESHLDAVETLLISTKTLENLYVSKLNCNLVHSITTGLRHNKSIKHLILRKLGFNGTLVSQFADSLMKHPNLTSLQISMHPGNYLLDQELIQLFHALGRCRSLERVAIRHSGIADHLVKPLCEMVNSNDRLTHLDLHHNHLSAEALGELAVCLSEKPHKLHCLDLSDCFVTEANPLVDVLRNHCCFLRINWF